MSRKGLTGLLRAVRVAVASVDVFTRRFGPSLRHSGRRTALFTRRLPVSSPAHLAPGEGCSRLRPRAVWPLTVGPSVRAFRAPTGMLAYVRADAGLPALPLAHVSGAVSSRSPLAHATAHTMSRHATFSLALVGAIVGGRHHANRIAGRACEVETSHRTLRTTDGCCRFPYRPRRFSYASVSCSTRTRWRARAARPQEHSQSSTCQIERSGHRPALEVYSRDVPILEALIPEPARPPELDGFPWHLTP